MVYRVSIEKGEDFGYVAHCPAIPGCHSQGDTIEDAIGNIKGGGASANKGCYDKNKVYDAVIDFFRTEKADVAFLNESSPLLLFQVAKKVNQWPIEVTRRLWNSVFGVLNSTGIQRN